MLARLAASLSRFSARYVPDAFVIALLLTFATAGAALLATDAGPRAVLRAWGDGFWDFLRFAMQMCLVVLTGFMLSTAPPVRRLLERVCSVARTPRGAVGWMALFSLALGLLHWGLSVAASAVLVRAMARRQPRADYRLLVCCAYLGVATIWHAGLSASAPLKVASEGHEFEAVMGVLPVTETLLHPFNLGLIALLLVLLPLLARALHPDDADVSTVDAADLGGDAGDPAPPAEERGGLAGRLEHSRVPMMAVGLAGVLWLVDHFARAGFAGLDIDSVNFVFLIAAVLLHGSAASFLRAAREGSAFLFGIVVQFPFYAGIAGILAGTGLSSEVAALFQRVATAETYPAILLLYSGALNYFVPSGGSQWIVSGQYVMEAANGLGVAPAHAMLAFAWGDMSTNLVQPFWAIPLLAVAGLRFRDIMGFGLLLFAAYLTTVTLAFLAFGFVAAS